MAASPPCHLLPWLLAWATWVLPQLLNPPQLFQGPSHPSLPPCQNYQLHSGEVNGGLPSVSGFSSASTAYGVSSHTPPISATDNMMGMASHQSHPSLHGQAQAHLEKQGKPGA